MRLIAICALAMTGVACGQPAEPAPAPVPSTTLNLAVNPARIDRARDHLPDDYEVTPYTGAPSPFAVWGLRDSPATDPAQCAALGAATAVGGGGGAHPDRP
ncbi:DUF5642 family protein, partial [Mycobacterium sp. NAZ190054]|uniref:DUF5642 family protein n=1 Tax=Mycobacterium sp. NAZ190054 TaxID=1747766 RepID=UPI000AD4C8BD